MTYESDTVKQYWKIEKELENNLFHGHEHSDIRYKKRKDAYIGLIHWLTQYIYCVKWNFPHKFHLTLPVTCTHVDLKVYLSAGRKYTSLSPRYCITQTITNKFGVNNPYPCITSFSQQGALSDWMWCNRRKLLALALAQVQNQRTIKFGDSSVTSTRFPSLQQTVKGYPALKQKLQVMHN